MTYREWFLGGVEEPVANSRYLRPPTFRYNAPHPLKVPCTYKFSLLLSLQLWVISSVWIPGTSVAGRLIATTGISGFITGNCGYTTEKVSGMTQHLLHRKTGNYSIILFNSSFFCIMELQFRYDFLAASLEKECGSQSLLLKTTFAYRGTSSGMSGSVAFDDFRI